MRQPPRRIRRESTGRTTPRTTGARPREPTPGAAGGRPEAPSSGARLRRGREALRVAGRPRPRRPATTRRPATLARAREIYLELKDFRRAAELFEKSGDDLKAAELYEAAFQREGPNPHGSPGGDNALQSGRLYEQAGAPDRAAAIYLKAGLLHRSRRDLRGRGGLPQGRGDLPQGRETPSRPPRASRGAGTRSRGYAALSRFSYDRGLVKEAASLRGNGRRPDAGRDDVPGGGGLCPGRGPLLPGGRFTPRRRRTSPWPTIRPGPARPSSGPATIFRRHRRSRRSAATGKNSRRSTKRARTTTRPAGCSSSSGSWIGP